MRSPYPYTPDVLPTNRGQWNAFVELLPLWLAPNMVTLLGFFFILTNVICLEIWMPDLVGPVGKNLQHLISLFAPCTWVAEQALGSVMAVL